MWECRGREDKGPARRPSKVLLVNWWNEIQQQLQIRGLTCILQYHVQAEEDAAQANANPNGLNFTPIQRHVRLLRQSCLGGQTVQSVCQLQRCILLQSRVSEKTLEDGRPQGSMSEDEQSKTYTFAICLHIHHCYMYTVRPQGRI